MEEALARGVQIFLALSVAYLLALWFALAVWAYRDINTRSQSIVTQVVGTLLVVLFSIPGALLYLLLRPKDTLDEAYQRSLEEEYLLQDLEEVSVCHSCQRPVDEEFMLCPHCQAILKEACPACARLIDARWSVCPYCGVNQSDRSTIIREQLPAAEERFVERGSRTFAPLQPPPATIQPAAQQVGPGVEERFIGPVFPMQEIDSGPQSFSEPLEDQEPSEPIRLFDRRRTRALKAAEPEVNGTQNGAQEASSNGVASEPDAEEPESSDLSAETKPLPDSLEKASERA